VKTSFARDLIVEKHQDKKRTIQYIKF